MGYFAVHRRLDALHGKASSHRCGCGRQASGWAYKHGDLDECVEVVNGHPRPYSLDPAYYLPLCQSCHTRLDRTPAYCPPDAEVPLDVAELLDERLVHEGALLGWHGR